jgi:signal transduction histidine kinase
MASRWLRPLQSVRVRITLAAVVVTAAAVGTAGWLLVRSVEGAQVRDIRNDVSAYVDQVTRRLGDGQDPRQAVMATDAALGPARVTVTDEQGQIVVSAPEPVNDGDGGDLPAADGRPGADEMMLGEIESLSRIVETPEGEFTITAVAPIDQVARNVDALTERLAVGLPVLVALVGVIAWVLVGRALRPVEAMRAEAERITGSTIHRRLPEPLTDDEVGRLARTMNTMLDRLETAAVQQRRFVSDASHELRSPVAAIRAGLEVARARPGPDGWPARVDGLLAEESRLESLLDDLLLLAASDEHAAIAAPTRSVNVNALAIEEGRRPRRVPVHVVNTPADSPAVVVAGVQQQLARALSNLVDNAARHAVSIVQLSVLDDGDTVRVIVDDDGPGIPTTDRERVFERFTRLDDGRARHDGGSGLGLAVVRSILASHHGAVRIDDSPLGGARFVAELPALACSRVDVTETA